MDNNIYKVTPRQARKFCHEIMSAGLVPFLQSSPGIGKSSIAKSIAQADNLKFIDHRMSTSAPEDLSGLPRFRADGRAEFAPFSELFPLEGDPIPAGKDGWMLFLDEFNSASKSVMAASYKLILDRMTGQHRLHENVAIMAAGNLMTDRGIVNPIGTAMQSRLIHLEMEANFEEWLYDVALAENYDSRIIAFLSQFPSKLMNFDPKHKDKTFCCPRTWEFMERHLKTAPVADERVPIYGGTISYDVAVEFVQFTKVYQNLVTVNQILADPLQCRLPDTSALRWATITHIMEKVDEKNFGPLCDYIERFPLDFKVLFYRSVMIRAKTLRSHPAFGNAMRTMTKYLQGA